MARSGGRLNDRASIQAVLSQLMRAAFAGQIEDDRLRTMVYTLQVALSNLRNLEPPGTPPQR